MVIFMGECEREKWASNQCSIFVFVVFSSMHEQQRRWSSSTMWIKIIIIFFLLVVVIIIINNNEDVESLSIIVWWSMCCCFVLYKHTLVDSSNSCIHTLHTFNNLYSGQPYCMCMNDVWEREREFPWKYDNIFCFQYFAVTITHKDEMIMCIIKLISWKENWKK